MQLFTVNYTNYSNKTLHEAVVHIAAQDWNQMLDTMKNLVPLESITNVKQSEFPLIIVGQLQGEPNSK